MSETYPNITWAVESQKPFDGTEWQKASGAMIRHMECEIRIAEDAIKAGTDPLVEMARIRSWLTDCLYSANGLNFKEGEFKPFSRE